MNKRLILNISKGVICKVLPRDKMPIDGNGNRADFVMADDATVSRMNLGRLYETYINGASRDVRNRIISIFGETPVHSAPDELINQAFSLLVEYYDIVSDKMGEWAKGIDKRKHLVSIVNDFIYLYIPPENQRELTNIVRQLEARFPQTYGPVTYTGLSGNKVTTKEPVRISSIYIIMLEKIGDDLTAVASGMLQHFGVLAPIPKHMKYSKPSRTQAIRAIGETEGRIYVSYVGPEATMDILDRNNSEESHEAVINSILEADKPSDIKVAVDRTKIAVGKSRPLQIVKHVAACSGFKFVYKDVR